MLLRRRSVRVRRALFSHECVPKSLGKSRLSHNNHSTGQMEGFQSFRVLCQTPANAAWSVSFTLDEIVAGSYLAIPLPGRHDAEGAYAAVRVGGRLVGAPSRAVSYASNVWEAPVQPVKGNYTYFVPLTGDMIGQPIEVLVLVMQDGINEIQPEAWVTAYPLPFVSKELVLKRK